MPGVRVKEGESFENAMKRFKKQCEKAGILSEIRKREHYEKPSVKRKKKALAAKKRALKKARKGSMYPVPPPESSLEKSKTKRAGRFQGARQAAFTRPAPS